MLVNAWMSWVGGVDLVAMSKESLQMPNVIVHVAQIVHTPIGSAPSGMILLPDETGMPKVMGFVSTDKNVGAYFGPNIFAGTPFENAPVLDAEIEVEIGENSARVSVKIENYEIVSELSELGELKAANREPVNLPFYDHSLESAAGEVKLTVNGEEISIFLPPVGMSGGPAAVVSSCGIYSR